MLKKLINKLKQNNMWSDEPEITEKPHPEVDNYGLNLDYRLWAELNKEKLIRNWIKSTRQYTPSNVLTKESPEYDFGDVAERHMAEIALDELIDFGHLDPVTYLRIGR